MYPEIDSSSFLIAWVRDNIVQNLYNSNLLVSSITERGNSRNANKNGIILMYEIPQKLNPKLPPLEQIKQDDSNHGINHKCTKMCINMY